VLEHLIKSRSKKAIYMVVIGKDYRLHFDCVVLPHVQKYCEKFDIGLFILSDYIDPAAKFNEPYSKDPGYQRLLIPGQISRQFEEYTLLADMDADCIPGYYARDIFALPIQEGYRDRVWFTRPCPAGYTRSSLGRRISLLRKMYHDPEFPLDSLLAADDEFEKRALGFDFDGEIATLGTCIGHVNSLASCGSLAYEAIKSNFSGYLQNYRNKIFRTYFNIGWLPYEYQAIWNYELALYYPFLYSSIDKKLSSLCVRATLSRVDMLHFAGSWPENAIFSSGSFNESNDLDVYFSDLGNYLDLSLDYKSYGRLKYRDKT
jgi:hypothetical protein